MTIKKLCTSTNEDAVTKVLPTGMTTPIDAIKFNENQVKWKKDTWNTPVTRYPDSDDDKVNIYLYPSEYTKNDDNSSVDVIPFWYYNNNSQMMQISQWSCSMRMAAHHQFLFKRKTERTLE